MLNDAEKMKKIEAQNKAYYQDMERAQSDAQIDQMKREQEMAKRLKRDFADNYKNDLKNQEKQKKFMTEREKDIDKLYCLLEAAQNEKTDAARKRFFDHVKGFQVKNDQKLASLVNFMNGRDFATLSKQDEERMMQQLKEKLMKDQKADDEKNIKLRNANMDNVNFLKRQMEEKKERERFQKIEDDAFAALIK